MSNTDSLFDVAIIGYGPAGVTAAIYCARKKLKVLLVGEMPGGEVRNSGEIENWPGGGETDGLTLSENLIKHINLHKDEVTIVEEKVSKISKDKDGIFSYVLNNEYYDFCQVWEEIFYEFYSLQRWPQRTTSRNI